MVITVAFLLLISLVLSATLAATTDWLGSILSVPEFVWQIIAFIFSTVVITFLFAMIFKILPDAKVAWKDVWLGALLTSLSFSAGKFL